ncbi:MAG TPA: TetR/AcrR family transcriptional regulator, partial [Bellilinea sp.]|nr:TetR/AcrR family transcriptional regulator [Bellilinea sp.]
MTTINRPITDEKILSTARALFTQLGFRAVGVDLIAKESGVSKMTMYRHFKSKEEVIAIYLEEQDQLVQKWFDSVILPYHGSPREQIIAIFDELQKSLR